ncbi:translation initiation factor eIF2B subunit delta-like [Sycon ciliatum]|uniref:translation initiation factor eIF2B subunit delta-like n=1 Tax=Sycon ciliatum TaxID=27933 RepID=UPI0020AB88A5|eukprot:scpid55272/ scgid2902/ Translation initiation factor eIF-2B subunit delta; eIF-2B GDP-GTP exchange factor subunit delta
MADAQADASSVGSATASPAPAGNESVAKSKLKVTTTKAERRAKQEAQRAAKADRLATDGKAPRKQQGPPPKSSEKSVLMPRGSEHQSEHHRMKPSAQADDPKVQAKQLKKLAQHNILQRPGETKCRLFSHLHQHLRNFPLTTHMPMDNADIHKSVLKLGIMYADYSIRGSNARCIALLRVLKEMILDYTTPKEKEMARDLESRLKPQISFLNTCRLISPSMGNAIKHIKVCISQLPPDLPEEESKDRLILELQRYESEKISLADAAIVQFGEQKITDGDVIMTFAYSTIVHKILRQAHRSGKRFRVLVVDSRPLYEGNLMLNYLHADGIQCSHLLLNATNYIMKTATKVLMGASTVLSNGHCISRVGTAMIAMMAKKCEVPVLIACETYKFSERVQTDAIVFNELGDPNDLVSTSCIRSAVKCHQAKAGKPLEHWDANPNLALVNPLFDVTPPAYISLLLTELGPLPCSSVPVVLRVKTP